MGGRRGGLGGPLGACLRDVNAKEQNHMQNEDPVTEVVETTVDAAEEALESGVDTAVEAVETVLGSFGGD